MRYVALTAVGLLACFGDTALAEGPAAPTVGPLVLVSPAQFLKLPGSAQATYVGGILDGTTYLSYAEALPGHDRYVHCVQTLSLDALVDKTARWLRANPKFTGGTATAVAIVLGTYCNNGKALLP